MIRVLIQEQEGQSFLIQVEGHQNPGGNLACNSVSTLSQALCESLIRLCPEENFEIENRKGLCRLSGVKSSNRNEQDFIKDILIQNFLIGLHQVKQKFPGEVEIELERQE